MSHTQRITLAALVAIAAGVAFLFYGMASEVDHPTWSRRPGVNPVATPSVTPWPPIVQVSRP